MANVLKMFPQLRPTDGEVGIEIEMEGDDLPRIDNPSWTTHADGSLRGRDSAEYVFNGPAHREDVEGRLWNLYTVLQQDAEEMDPSDRCGVHVHINVQDLSYEHLLNFVTLYIILEEPLMEFCGEQRVGNPFCLRIKDAEFLLNVLISIKKNGTFNIPHLNDKIRYASLNLTSLPLYGSLEFRGHRSVDNPAPIEKWVDILLRLKDAACEFENQVAILEQFSMDGPRFVADVILKDFKKDIDVAGLQDMLWDGARLAQEFVYTTKGGRLPEEPRQGGRVIDKDEAIANIIIRARRRIAERDNNEGF